MDNSKEKQSFLPFQSEQEDPRMGEPLQEKDFLINTSRMLRPQSENFVQSSQHSQMNKNYEYLLVDNENLRQEVQFFKSRYEQKQFELSDQLLANHQLREKIVQLKRELEYTQLKVETYSNDLHHQKQSFQAQISQISGDRLVQRAEKLLTLYEDSKSEIEFLKKVQSQNQNQIFQLQSSLNETKQSQLKQSLLIDKIKIQMQCNSDLSLLEELRFILEDYKKKQQLFNNLKETMVQTNKIKVQDYSFITEKQIWKFFQSVFNEYLDLKVWQSEEKFMIETLLKLLKLKREEDIIPYLTNLNLKFQAYQSITQKIQKFLHLENHAIFDDLEKKIELSLARRFF